MYEDHDFDPVEFGRRAVKATSLGEYHGSSVPTSRLCLREFRGGFPASGRVRRACRAPSEAPSSPTSASVRMLTRARVVLRRPTRNRQRDDESRKGSLASALARPRAWSDPAWPQSACAAGVRTLQAVPASVPSRRGVAIETAMLSAAVRKAHSGLPNGASGPVATQRFRKPVIGKIQQRPQPPGHCDDPGMKRRRFVRHGRELGLRDLPQNRSRSPH